MAIRDTWRADASTHLQPGESIQAVVPAQTSYPHPVLVASLYGIARRTARLVIATNERILIFRRTASGALGELLEERPRDIVIGPPRAVFVFYSTTALGERLYIHRRWWNDIRAADEASATRAPV
ncbi:MAG TPA: hypothetical protein VGG41_19195 [Solirubrobacteraceae bacterium]|jgi:hypothetical protein